MKKLMWIYTDINTHIHAMMHGRQALHILTQPYIQPMGLQSTPPSSFRVSLEPSGMRRAKMIGSNEVAMNWVLSLRHDDARCFCIHSSHEWQVLFMLDTSEARWKPSHVYWSIFHQQTTAHQELFWMTDGVARHKELVLASAECESVSGWHHSSTSAVESSWCRFYHQSWMSTWSVKYNS